MTSKQIMNNKDKDKSQCSLFAALYGSEYIGIVHASPELRTCPCKIGSIEMER